MKLIHFVLLAAICSPALAIPEGPEEGTPEWEARETANFAKVSEAPNEQTAPEFQSRLQQQSNTNQISWTARAAADPSWLDPRSGNTEFTPLCTSWMEQCAGDPFRYPGVDDFYENEAEISEFVIYDDECARISGRVWAPAGSSSADALPAVVIETGSVQAPEPLYWWMAQALVRQGYVTLTFDVRGQGRSDFQTPTGGQGGNSNSEVFFGSLVNVIDFFRSSPDQEYPHNATCAGTYPTPVVNFNPFHNRIDPDRFGIAGHSLGASGVTGVQAFGAPGEDPWPGLIDDKNPVDVIVAWDSLSSGFTPRVPAMGHTSEYSLTPVKKATAPDPEGHKNAYQLWVESGLPVWQATIQGSSHYEWSLIPTFPTSSWCPDSAAGNCNDGWGRPFAEHYSVAWFDRWLKLPGEVGHDDADSRLLAEADFCERFSFYSRSAYNFPLRAGAQQINDDIRASCLTAMSVAPQISESQTAAGGSTVDAGQFQVSNDGLENRTVETIIVSLSNPALLSDLVIALPDGSEISISNPEASNEFSLATPVNLANGESADFAVSATISADESAATSSHQLMWGQIALALTSADQQGTVAHAHYSILVFVVISLMILSLIRNHRLRMLLFSVILLSACGSSNGPAQSNVELANAQSTAIILSRIITNGNSGTADIGGLPSQIATITRQQ